MSGSTRRSFLTSLAATPLLTAVPIRTVHPTQMPAPAPGPSALPASFPAQDPTVVREVVGASHGNVAKVRELVGARPALALATWDWGFGDWESALGAASHVGNREIAEYLLAHGARPTLFSATMLGQLDVVKALIAAAPGSQRIKGPHGITLLRHAQAGGDRAKTVYDYLVSIGDADDRPAAAPLSTADRDRLLGTYVFGDGAADRLEVTLQRDALMVGRTGGVPRGLTHLGNLEFYPAGAEAVRVRFTGEGAATTLAVVDGPLTVRAVRG